MLSSGRDACECHVSLPEEVRIGERTTCPSLGSPDGVAPDTEARHVSLGGGEGSLQCPPFNLPILPRQNGWVKNDCFFETEVTFFAHWATWCAEAKRNKSIYDGPPSLGFPRQRVFSIMARLSG